MIHYYALQLCSNLHKLAGMTGIITVMLFVACNSHPGKPANPGNADNPPKAAQDKDSCAIAQKYENAQVAESLVDKNYSGELNNYMGNDKTKLDFKHVYKNGKLVKSYFYYLNQKVQEEYSFLCGSLHGLQKWYYEDGALAKVVPYSYGYRNGVGQLYNKSGILVQTATFRNDSLIGEVQNIDKPGNIHKDSSKN